MREYMLHCMHAAVELKIGFLSLYVYFLFLLVGIIFPVTLTQYWIFKGDSSTLTGLFTTKQPHG